MTSSFSAQDAQLAFAVLGSATCSTDSYSNLLQPLLVRASTSVASCPLLIALRDILQRKSTSDSTNITNTNQQQFSAQTLISQQMTEYETDLRDAERQLEPLKIARDKLKAELQRVETLLGQADTSVRRSNDGVLVCRSLLQAVASNSENGFDTVAATNLIASTTTSGVTNTGASTSVNQISSSQQPQQSQPQSQQQQSSSSSSSAAASSSNPQEQYYQSQATNQNQATAIAQQQQQNNFSEQQQQQQQQNQQQQQETITNNNQQQQQNTPSIPTSQQQQNVQQQQTQHVVPPTIEATIDILKKCQHQGRDDEYRSQLIPAIARVEAKLQKSNSSQKNTGTTVVFPVDETHAALATTIMQTVHLLHESVQVHALRAVLAMLRKVAEDRSQTFTGSLSAKLHSAQLHACCNEQGFKIFIDLFSHGHDDDVKAEVLECLGVLVAEGHYVELICGLGAVDPLVQLVATSTSEPVLERALLLFWSLAAGSDRVRDEALKSGGVRALVDLLYTDSLPILDNAMIALGYLSRDERAKLALAEGGGLEKIVSCLYHPNASVLVKAAGVVWNAAVIDNNRTHLRSLGAVPALLQLLRSTNSELARENISGALWNLTIDAEAKKQLAEFEGLQMFVQLLAPSHSENVLENASGTLWNCSATVDNRAALRRHGALPPLLALLEHPSERIQENVAGAIRNLVINDHNKVAIRECGGIETILGKLNHSWREVTASASSQNNSENNHSSTATGVIDKLVSTLWILTVTPENCQRLQPALSLLLNFASSTILPIGVREKVVGTLRHTCRLPENRKPLVQLGAFRVLVNLAASLGLCVPCEAIAQQLITSPPMNTSITLRENFAYILWNLAREDREEGRKSGALGVVTFLLGDQNDNVVEFAAGSAAALINHASNDGRNELGQLGGVHRLLDILLDVSQRVSRPSSSSSEAQIVLLHNTIHALRYATSANCEGNISLVLDRPEDLVTKLIEMIERNPMLSSSSQNQTNSPTTTAGAISADDISREAILFLKNILHSRDSRVSSREFSKCSPRLIEPVTQIMVQAASRTSALSSSSSTTSTTSSPNNESSALLHRAAQSLQQLLSK